MFIKFRSGDLIVKVLMFLAFAFFVCYVVFPNAGHAKDASTVKPLTNIDASTSTIVLLFWNKFFSDSRWMLPADTVHFQCPRTNCVFTNQREYLPNVNLYDGIIFHTARPFSLFSLLPRERDARQMYVFTQLESPDNSYHKLDDENDFYNLTMTYRLDSDVVWSYNTILDKETSAQVAPALQPKWRRVEAEWTQTDPTIMALVRGKHKPIAWFVSNCKVPSRREELVRQLQAHISVDTYGQCGPLQCTRGNAECDQLLDDTYNFYLSFENSLCTDYVTEKFYNALLRYVVPVVFGGANYTHFAPPHSYIDAQAFDNVSALAAHLSFLHETPHEYAKYFWWRRYYTVSHTDLQPLPACDLCHRIQLHARQKRTQTYRDIEYFWRQSACTRQTRIEL